ncbi:hypothetical protein MMC16_002474 [Acarospora aff. strigata]|nr:hypothetical protein [Acarospora aff. strigata]
MVPSTNTSNFTTSHNTNILTRGDMLVQFSILDNSYGCQLEFNFAQGFKDLADGEESNQLDIWTTDRVIRPDDDWACAPEWIEIGSKL